MVPRRGIPGYLSECEQCSLSIDSEFENWNCGSDAESRRLPTRIPWPPRKLSKACSLTNLAGCEHFVSLRFYSDWTSVAEMTEMPSNKSCYWQCYDRSRGELVKAFRLQSSVLSKWLIIEKVPFSCHSHWSVIINEVRLSILFVLSVHSLYLCSPGIFDSLSSCFPWRLTSKKASR